MNTDIDTLDRQRITIETHLDAEGELLYEEVTCETGAYPILRLVTSDGVCCADD